MSHKRVILCVNSLISIRFPVMFLQSKTQPRFVSETSGLRRTSEDRETAVNAKVIPLLH